MTPLLPLDSLEILVLVDNELDPISASPNPAVQQTGGLRDLGRLAPKLPLDERGGASAELRMDQICCGAHGLSLLITGVRGEERRSILFDTGPEADVWERNARRLNAPIGNVEMLQLSHWHRDHSGGMLRALDLITAASASASGGSKPVEVDLHPNRPAYRGFRPPGIPPVSLEADPTFTEIEQHGGIVRKTDKPHLVAGDFFLVSGEIPRVTRYEQGLKFGVRFDAAAKEWVSDEKIADERFLMCKVKGKGIVMFTGCSHAGVVNASRHALELGGGDGTPLYGVMGGFHLADAEAAQITATATDLKELGIKLLFTGHCTGWRAKFEIQRQIPGGLVPSFVGTRYTV